ncbi:MAG: cell division protein FtsH [Candidatus Doudnabacteria bacterium CG10_big_fil_rev_8_21_14_0_10_42_18]|uniref:ATP-dependent zinc metalloprotease FtsH n=1 Tax=Candidatus Doudnabacteria bacterium CG10_big_fil_rev_8_21_14_0_10_42_18 TaxID=1974552 RepID=A0A2H0VD35_9BACT|nr:MAG: cell division protein FtsH [Candidatus Doudnabacteria bacterium CG10_big_fil_rev_8_21_14_0_10_42_18]
MGKIVKNIILVLIGFLFITAIFSAFSGDKQTQEISLTEVVNLVDQEKVNKLVVEDGKVTVLVKDSDVEQYAKLGKNDNIFEILKNNEISQEKIRVVDIQNKSGGFTSSLLGAILPFLIPFLFIGLFIWFMMRQVQGSNNRALSFGQSSVKLSDERKNKVKFKDVAGAKEAKEELTEVVDFLRFPQKFLQIGAKIPKGVLLLGAPGVGKTLLSRAVAGEANVPFFHISGSEFVEMFVGVGASRVRDLFKKAKKNAPCIVFIDEIDAVGRQRGAGLGGGHDEREQTLNQILVEMDGFETDTNVIVIAATNRPDVLDPALLRPGRFDRQVVLDLPDIADREAILKVHAKNKPLSKEVNLRVIAERTPGFSGADLANLVNEAAIFTARQNKKVVGQKELTESIEKVMMGPERKSHILSKKEKEITAYHEGGHALVGSALMFADPVHKISIISRGRAAGYTMKLPVEDKHLHTRQGFFDEIAALLGGFAAEKLVFNELTTGASNDLKVATGMARKLVMNYGMSEALGPVTFGNSQEMVFLGKEIHEQRNYSEEVAKQIDDEVSRIMKQGLKTASELLAKHRDYLEKIARRLIEKETIEQEEFAEMVKDIIPAGKKTKPEFQELEAEAENELTPAKTVKV